MSRSHQKLMEPSPFRPQTTMAIEKLNTAAREAQPRVKSIVDSLDVGSVTKLPCGFIPSVHETS